MSIKVYKDNFIFIQAIKIIPVAKNPDLHSAQ
jgi:hypothetical protein